MSFCDEHFTLFHGVANAVGNAIVEAKVSAVCVRSGEKFTKDIAHPDTKIWFIIEADLACGSDSECVLFATDGERYVPVEKRRRSGLVHFSVYGSENELSWLWQFGVVDQMIVKALIANKLGGA